MAFVLIVQECLQGLKDRSDLGTLVQASRRAALSRTSNPLSLELNSSSFTNSCLGPVLLRRIGAFCSRP